MNLARKSPHSCFPSKKRMKMKTTSFIRYFSKMWVFVTLGLRVTRACSHFATLLYILMQPFFFVYTRPVTSLFRCILIHNKVNLTSLCEFFISVKPCTEYSEKFSVIVICKSLIHNPVARCRIYWFFYQGCFTTWLLCLKEDRKRDDWSYLQ